MTKGRSIALLWPDTDAALQRVAPAEQLKVALAACRSAALSSGLDDALVQETIDSIAAGSELPVDAKEKLAQLVNQFDQQYFELGESETSAKGETAFAKARAAAAVAALADGNTDDAIYEAAYGHAELDDFHLLLKKELA